MINKLVLENLKDHWVRTLLSALVVGVQVMSILTLVGLSEGLLRQSAARARGTGADIFLRNDPHGQLSIGTGQVSEKFLDVVRQQPHVVQAVAVLTQVVELFSTMNGVDVPQFEKISGGFHYLAGAAPKTPDGLLVDDSYAREKKLHVGDPVRLLNCDWRLSGVVEGGMLARFVVPLEALQKCTANSGKISQILVKLDDPLRTDEVVAALNQQFTGNLKAQSLAEVMSQFTIERIPMLKPFIGVIIGVGVVVALLVVFLSMYTAVVQRTREIGILKALGAKPFLIVNLLVREAIVLSLIGWVIGIGLAMLAKSLVSVFMPASLTIINVPMWWPLAAVIALTGALFGAIYPGLKAARQDAIEALAYE